MVPFGDNHTERVSYCPLDALGIPGLTLLELELFDTRFIGSNGCALYTDGILLDGLGGIDSDLVVGLISVRKSL